MELPKAMNPQPTTGEVLEALVDFRDAVFTRFDSVDRTLQDHSSILEQHSQILNRHERRLDAIDNRLDGIDHRLDSVVGRLGRIEAL